MAKGLFISFEGGDGSGKTTALRYILQELQQRGYDVVYTREPGGSEIAEQIRRVILDVDNTNMEVRTEALLYAASRRQHLVEKIIPALEAGKIVLCDRFVDSSLAYQGYARHIGIDEVYNINLFAIDNYMPDLTIYFDVTPEVGLSRVGSRGGMDRLDKESLTFHQEVHEGYRLVCERYPERIKVINADQSEEEVKQQAMELLLEWLSEHV